MNKQKNNAKGITLVALVITIIVLVILVGVTLSVTLNTGLIDNSKTAVTANKEETIKEAATIIYADWHVRKQKGDTTVGENPLEYIKEELEKQEFDSDLIEKIQISNGKILINEFNYVKSIAHPNFLELLPMNSMYVYEAASEVGLEYLEADVRITSDGVLVLNHDATINNKARNSDGSEITETINISQTTYQELQNYDFGIYQGEQYAGMKILTLDEFISYCKENNKKPYIELKASCSSEVIEVLEQYDMIEKATITTSGKTIAQDFISQNSGIRLGFLVDEITSDTIDFCTTLMSGNSQVFLDSSDYDADAVALCKEANIPLEVWVINDYNTMLNLDPYISGVTSDYYNAKNVLYYNEFANYEVVKVINADELKNNTSFAVSAPPYYSNASAYAGRIAYTDFDIPVEYGYIYKVEFDSTISDAKMAIQFYTEKAAELMANGENITGHYLDSGWKDSGLTRELVRLYNDGYKYKTMRVQFNDASGNKATDYISSATISRKRIQ